MDSLLHLLGLGYFVFMGAAALWGIEDLILPAADRPKASLRRSARHVPDQFSPDIGGLPR